MQTPGNRHKGSLLTISAVTAAAALLALLAAPECHAAAPVRPRTKPSAAPVRPSPKPSAATVHPSPKLSAMQVMNILVTALQHNDSAHGNGGIRTVFEFSSPSNRSATGPLPRFIAMVKSPSYRALVGFKKIVRGPVVVIRGRAEERLTVTGADKQTITFMWMLSKQTTKPYAGCWMTEGVTRQSMRIRPKTTPTTTASCGCE